MLTQENPETGTLGCKV